MKSIVKNILIFLFGIILLFLFFSCSTRKKTTTKESVKTVYDTLIKRDSIFIEREKVVYMPSSNSSVIPNPCNEKGKLNPINENIKFPNGNANIKSDENGNLKFQVNTDSISSVYENQYQERNEKQLQQITELQKENTSLKITPFNWWKWIGWISIGFNVIFIGILIKNRFSF